MKPLPTALEPSFHGVLLVCRECEKRGSGPKDLRSKDVRKVARQCVKAERGRVRVVTSSCLGPCPKKAMTVAFVASDPAASRMAAVADEAQAEAAISGFLAR